MSPLADRPPAGLSSHLEKIARLREIGAFHNFSLEEVEGSLPARFARIAAGFPDRTAVSQDGFQITYQALDQLSNRIARDLLKQAGKQKEPVCLLTEHGIPQLIAILGTVKSGKFFTNLNPVDPVARLLQIKTDLPSRIILSDRRNFALARQVASENDRILVISESKSSDSDSPVQVPIRPTDLLGVFYSSGSTGEPKGIPVTHRNALYRVWVQSNLYFPCVEDHLTHLSSTSFTASISDAFNALLNGAALHPRLITAADGGSIQIWIEKEGITVLRMVASLLRAVLDSLQPEAFFPSIRLVIAGGDVFRRTDLNKLFAHLPDHALFMNRYSAGEAGTIASIFLDRDSARTSVILPSDPAPTVEDLLPAGFPVPGTDLLVLDERRNPLPVGQVGEIAVRSRFLFPGYWRRPDLSEKKLASDPGSGQPIVLTGDYGLIRQDGLLELRGRQDFVAKIRGYRVEMQAVERALESIEYVRRAAVVASEKAGEEKKLVACIVLNQSLTEPVQRLREALGQMLPDYMIPSHFIFMKALPLTANGKIDRKALPAPVADRRMQGTPFVHPVTPLEQKLAEIWKEVLQVERVALTDNFLLLGGDSLSAVKILARIYDLFQVEISIREFFAAPTVAWLAEVISSSISGWHAVSEPVNIQALEPPLVRRKVDEGPFPLSFAQERMWILHQLDPQAAVYNEPKVFKITGEIDICLLERSFQSIIERHEILRTNYSWHPDGPRQIPSRDWAFTLPVGDLQHEPDPQAAFERLSALEIGRSFDLSRDLMIRAAFFRLSAHEAALVIVTHHIASDQLSTRQLLTELSLVYRQLSESIELALPEPELQYIDFALWQRCRMSGQRLEKQLAYWKLQLAGLSSLEFSLTSQPNPQVSLQGEHRIYSLPSELSLRIKEFSRSSAKTIYVTLIAAFAVLIYRLSGQPEFGLGMLVSNRSRPELEKMLGFLVNTLVLRLKFNPETTFRTFLEEVEQRVLGALEHQEIPFEKLVEVLNPKRDLDRNPFFQILFNLDDRSNPSLVIPGASVERMEIHPPTSKFDLSLTVVDQPPEMHLRFEYKPNKFDMQAVGLLASAYRVMLQTAISDPDQPISSLPLQSADQPGIPGF